MLGKTTQRCSVVIACNVLAFRDALRRLLAPEPDLEIIAEASNPSELASILRRDSSEVVLWCMSPTDEIVADALQEVAARWTETRMVVLVESDSEHRRLSQNRFKGDVLALRDVTIPESRARFEPEESGDAPLARIVSTPNRRRLASHRERSKSSRCWCKGFEPAKSPRLFP